MKNDLGLEWDERPWGRYDCLEEEDSWKVKRHTIKPGGKNSYQRHKIRTEIWVVVSGSGRFLIDDNWIEAGVGEVVKIPVNTKHRWHNTGKDDLILIEVQTGTYFGEDDIERLEDDYGREGTVPKCIDGKLIS